MPPATGHPAYPESMSTRDESPRPDIAVLLRPAHAPNAFEETVQRLLQTIRLGLIPPGDRLPPERELAVMLAVSRDTLREAIAALSEAGYVESRRGRYGGTFVSSTFPDGTPFVDGSGELRPRKDIPVAEIEDTLVLRRILEVGAAREAASVDHSEDAAARVERAQEDCRAAAPADYRRLDARFHLLVAELCGSSSLVPLVADVRMRINELLDRIPLLETNLAHSNEQHEEILQAILRRRPAAAAEAMSEHVAGSEALLRGFLA